MIRKIATPFFPDQESLDQLLLQGQGGLLERLRHAAQETTAIGEILSSPACCKFRRDLISRVRGAAQCMVWRRRFQQAVDHVVALNCESKFGRSLPRHVAVKD